MHHAILGANWFTYFKKYFFKASLYFFVPLFFVACKENKANEPTEPRYPDGIYCSEIDYHNPNTGKRNTYTLNVEVQNNELIKIIWNNGGWLDDSHFTPQELDNQGRCSFTSDKGYEYDIRITGSQCSSTDNINSEGEKIVQITLEKCASIIQMTEDELAQYERKNNISRNEIITSTYCDVLFKYTHEMRALNNQIQSMDDEVSEGYIHRTLTKNEGTYNPCRVMIIKRKNLFYLFEVAGTQKLSMGLTSFNPNNDSWQDIIVKETFDSQSANVYSVRIIASSSIIETLNDMIENYCENK